MRSIEHCHEWRPKRSAYPLLLVITCANILIVLLHVDDPGTASFRISSPASVEPRRASRMHCVSFGGHEGILMPRCISLLRVKRHNLGHLKTDPGFRKLALSTTVPIVWVSHVERHIHPFRLSFYHQISRYWGQNTDASTPRAEE